VTSQTNRLRFTNAGSAEPMTTWTIRTFGANRGTTQPWGDYPVPRSVSQSPRAKRSTDIARLDQEPGDICCFTSICITEQSLQAPGLTGIDFAGGAIPPWRAIEGWTVGRFRQATDQASSSARTVPTNSAPKSDEVPRFFKTMDPPQGHIYFHLGDDSGILVSMKRLARSASAWIIHHGGQSQHTEGASRAHSCPSRCRFPGDGCP
jgi:hypothetical protein